MKTLIIITICLSLVVVLVYRNSSRLFRKLGQLIALQIIIYLLLISLVGYGVFKSFHTQDPIIQELIIKVTFGGILFLLTPLFLTLFRFSIGVFYTIIMSLGSGVFAAFFIENEVLKEYLIEFSIGTIILLLLEYFFKERDAKLQAKIIRFSHAYILKNKQINEADLAAEMARAQKEADDDYRYALRDYFNIPRPSPLSWGDDEDEHNDNDQEPEGTGLIFDPIIAEEVPEGAYSNTYSKLKYEYEFTLQAFNENFISSGFCSTVLGFHVEYEDDKPNHYTFSSEHLNDLTDPVEIYARGRFLLALFKGAYSVFVPAVHGSYPVIYLQLSRLYKGQVDITPEHYSEILPVKSFGNINNNYPEYDDAVNSNPVGKIISVAKDRDEVQNLLLQIAAGIDWINLHSILDSLEFYAGAKFNDMLTAAGFTNADVKAFTGTVNNFGLLSVEARHGDLGFGTPKRTLNIEESRKMILDLVRAYIKVVYGIQ